MMEDLRLSSKLDEDFLSVMVRSPQQEVQHRSSVLSKLEKVRVSMWGKKLCQVTVNAVWKKNRNSYARQLRDMLTLGKLRAPFDRLPPQGHLPQLHSGYVSSTKPVTSSKQYSPRGIFKPTISTTKSEAILRRSTAPSALKSPRTSETSEVHKLKAHNKVLTDELKAEQLLTMTIRGQLTVSARQRRDEVIRLQRQQIEGLRRDLGFHKEFSSAHSDVHEDSSDEQSDFLSYLDNFQKEAVNYTQAQLTAETEALLSMHEHPKLPSVQLSPVRSNEVSEQHITIEYGLCRDLLTWSDKKSSFHRS
jgi:hypothetical protein